MYVYSSTIYTLYPTYPTASSHLRMIFNSMCLILIRTKRKYTFCYVRSVGFLCIFFWSSVKSRLWGYQFQNIRNNGSLQKLRSYKVCCRNEQVIKRILISILMCNHCWSPWINKNALQYATVVWWFAILVTPNIPTNEHMWKGHTNVVKIIKPWFLNIPLIRSYFLGEGHGFFGNLRFPWHHAISRWKKGATNVRYMCHWNRERVNILSCLLSNPSPL